MPVPAVIAPPTVSKIYSAREVALSPIYGLVITVLPVPFGVNSKSPLVSVVLIVLPFKSKLSTFKLSNLELESVTRAELAVNAPFVWSSISVKYLPPITKWFAALPAVSLPIPMYKRSPPFDPLSVKAEYASSPAASVAGLPLTDERLILIIDAIFYFLR